MTDKILKEAFDKLSAIEEADDYVPMSKEERAREQKLRDIRNSTGQEDSSAFDHVTGGYQNYKPEEANDTYDKKTGKWSRSGQFDEAMDDSIHDKTIDFLDDMLAGLDRNDQYGEKGDMLRYALTRLQQRD